MKVYRYTAHTPRLSGKDIVEIYDWCLVNIRNRRHWTYKICDYDDNINWLDYGNDQTYGLTIKSLRKQEFSKFIAAFSFRTLEQHTLFVLTWT